MKYLLLTFIISLTTSLFCQTKRIKNDYANGSIESVGKVIPCKDYDEKYTCTDTKCRKIGKWLYYYQSGKIKRIENYKKIIDCSSASIANGIWQYFNENGILIKEDEYKDGLLWKSDISKYYFNEQLAGEIIIRNGLRDTLVYINDDSINIVKNGCFYFYNGPPQFRINDGKKRIEYQIPFWITPNSNTPDYYNQFRRLNNVPDNIPEADKANYNYVGIILYHQPTGNYSEYITGTLNKKIQSNKRYRIKIRIRLSQNSGYYIDRLGILFSKNIPEMPNTIEKQQNSPQTIFTNTLDNRKEWITLCSLYTASGDEKYITIGRFSSVSETTINKIKPSNVSEGEYNQSAYYLIDEVLLIEDSIKCNCENHKQDFKLIERRDFDKCNSLDSNDWNVENTYILKNIYFDFDKSVLLPASFLELGKLFDLLFHNNYSITIMGHTDNIGTDKYNKELSLSRAKAVSDWLIDKGVNPNRIKVIGYGADVPILDNNSSENRAVNRRVEFKINK